MFINLAVLSEIVLTISTLPKIFATVKARAILILDCCCLNVYWEKG